MAFSTFVFGKKLKEKNNKQTISHYSFYAQRRPFCFNLESVLYTDDRKQLNESSDTLKLLLFHKTAFIYNINILNK